MPITFDEIKKVDNGAQFFDADLHVHSFGASHDVNDSTMTVEAIIDAAVKQGIRILSITDHNTDTNTLKSIQYAQKYTGEILVLPGVEITTSHGHLLVYFSPTQAANVRNLLAKINIAGNLGDQNSHTAMSMANVIGEAELLGGICIAAHIDRTKTGFEMLVPGYPNWKKDILLSSGLYALELDNSQNLVWYSEADEPTTNGTERKKLSKLRANTPAMAGRPLLAHIQGSDAHSLRDFTAGRSRKALTRFKLNELSYDAFKTALIDPDARVRAIASIPPALPRILGMQIVGGFLDGEKYHFSDNLNCFIGGRGTGKSTALRILAYGLGVNDDLDSHENCPGTVVIYCRDGNGIPYRYEKVQGSAPIVQAKEGGEIIHVSADAFRVEYYQQGELAEVAKNPLKNPILLQQFLDRHLLLADLLVRQDQLVSTLKENSAQLIPLEGRVGQLAEKQKTLAEINTKLQVAETGHLKDIAADQDHLSNEKNLAISIGEIRDEYANGLSLSVLHRDYTEYEAAVAPLTGKAASNVPLQKIKKAIDDINTFLKAKETEIAAKLKTAKTDITNALAELKEVHSQLATQLNLKITDLQKKGLQGNIAELQSLLKQKSSLTIDIGKINNQIPQLKQLRKDRSQYLAALETLRAEIMERRKAQLNSINENLAATIKDYTVFVRYEPSGIIEEFKQLMLEKMQGTHFQEEVADQFCSRITPSELAKLLLYKKFDEIVVQTGIVSTWPARIHEKLCYYETLHKLEVMWKSPCPVILVKTKGASPKGIPVNQLSDGQKHTIMLTIAMLAESNIPLVIDQPEDDLDNAFIFTTVVKALRSIKERRQVILVTHNANIAVLGDAELLLPMRRNGDGGCAHDSGSIDKTETKKAALDILEGGDDAFLRRKEIYGY